MSSEVLTVTLVANTTNCIGYSTKQGDDITVGGQAGKEIYGAGPVRLVRDVASIALASAEIDNLNNANYIANYISKDFVLKEVFIASAKGVSCVASASNWGGIEKTFDFTNTGFGYSNYMVGKEFSGSPNIDEGSYKKELRQKEMN